MDIAAVHYFVGGFTVGVCITVIAITMVMHKIEDVVEEEKSEKEVNIDIGEYVADRLREGMSVEVETIDGEKEYEIKDIEKDGNGDIKRFVLTNGWARTHYTYTDMCKKIETDSIKIDGHEPRQFASAVFAKNVFSTLS